MDLASHKPVERRKGERGEEEEQEEHDDLRHQERQHALRTSLVILMLPTPQTT